ncbi:RNA polymerase sigma-70 factor [Parabacteroides sp. OttesenSCG-928-K15]|nr:RNA polymerase sigma-70 factor [Parabacteroides sp. OttesenSCG-928-K15]
MTFNQFYVHWYARMKRFACEYVLSPEDAEDIIQDVFLELHNSYDSLSSRVNMVAYLFTTIKNRCIDHLRRKITEQESMKRIHEESLLSLRMKFDSLEVLDNNLFSESEVGTIIEKALESLPERCRIILIKHKIEGMRQKEIAEELNISPKTVENQLTIAYKKLREALKQYPTLLLLFL